MEAQMDFLLDPNIAYLILLAGIFLSFLAFATPGTGLMELGALFCFVLAGYAAYNLSINWWALVILALSVIPFVMAVRNPSRGIYLGVSIVFLILGSVFLFASKDGLISVNPIVAVVASGLVSVSLWFILRKSIEAMSRKPTHDPDALVGQVGETKSRIHSDGSVYIGGEMWSARSETEIPSGQYVRVIRREGFTLVVESTNHSNS
jgi:membrane-bound serine protease (ClpP class)